MTPVFVIWTMHGAVLHGEPGTKVISFWPDDPTSIPETIIMSEKTMDVGREFWGRKFEVDGIPCVSSNDGTSWIKFNRSNGSIVSISGIPSRISDSQAVFSYSDVRDLADGVKDPGLYRISSKGDGHEIIPVTDPGGPVNPIEIPIRKVSSFDDPTDPTSPRIQIDVVDIITCTGSETYVVNLADPTKPIGRFII